MRPCFLLLACLCPLAASADVAQDLKACADIYYATERLACYDAVSGRDRNPVAAPTTPPAVVIPPAPAPAPATAGTFGKPVPSAEPDSIAAHIQGRFDGWKKGRLFTLDNGQVWKCVDDSEAFYPHVADNAEVTLSKRFFGYVMEVKPIGRRIVVQRVK